MGSYRKIHQMGCMERETLCIFFFLTRLKFLLNIYIYFEHWLREKLPLYLLDKLREGGK